MPDISPLQQMRESLNAQIGMTDKDWSVVAEQLKIVHIPKKTLIQVAGEAVTYHYFLCRGLVRLFYPTREGKELNKGFYGNSVCRSLTLRKLTIAIMWLI
jgi:CRP-like cAMP-binding protein